MLCSHVSNKDYKVASSLSFAYQYFVMEDSFRLHQMSNTTSRSMLKNNFNHQNHSRLLRYDKKNKKNAHTKHKYGENPSTDTGDIAET